MKKPIFKIYTVFFFGIFCALFSYFLSQRNNYTTQELAKFAESQLHKKENIAIEKLELLSTALKTIKPKDLFAKYEGSLSDLYEVEGIAIYVYRNDSLCFWTNNQPAIDLFEYGYETQAQLIKIRNGWYEYIKLKKMLNQKYSLIALITIKPEYDFENRYLNNNFSSWFKLPENTKLLAPVRYLNHSVTSKFGNPLFEIYRSNGLYKNQTIDNYVCILALIACLLFLVAFFLFLKSKINHQLLFVLVFTSICLTIRSAMMYFKIPEVFYRSSLYDAKLFADASSFYFSYLGDVLINSVLIFIISISVYKVDFKVKLNNRLKNIATLIGSLFVIVLFSIQIRLLIYSLVNNSTISYNINELFSFSLYSLIGLVSVGLLFFSFYLLSEKFIIFLLQLNFFKPIIALILGSLIILLFIAFHLSSISCLDYLWPVVLMFIQFYLRKNKVSFNIIIVGFIVLVATFIVSSLFSNYEKINKKQTFEAIAMGLADRQDVIAENEFIKISNSIKKDLQLKNLLSSLPFNSDQIEQQLRQKNFTGYFERYEIIMSLFKGDCTPVFVNINAIYLNEDYFKEQIEKNSFQTICKDLYFIDKEKKSIKYIAKIDIEDLTKNPDKTFHLYLQLEPKLAVNLGTFPDLLLDKSLENKLESKRISYAVYDSNKLLTTFGEYQYPLFINNHFFNTSFDDGYEHFLINLKKNVTIVITDKELGLWGRFTSNSYLFIFFSILVLISVWVNEFFIKKTQRLSSLNNRIQFILVSIVILSLAGVVVGTIWVVNTQFELKNKNDLILKSQSVLKELNQNIAQQEILDPNFKEVTSYRLKRLAQLFGSDISLFNKQGILYATSQPAIYEQGLVSKFMNPSAFAVFNKSIIANYTQKENIGTLKYLSAYIPFYSKNDKLLGYINLPYFSRQKDLEKELTAYLTTLINIYTILFVITILIALLVSNLLTKPLRIIKQQISNIQFGKFNEALHWDSNDEIGNLVAEYNNMLVKLEKSSELLAQSERESAWREMAKQVAHEIKNPLTPMKLNIQHLQRIFEARPEDMNERVNKVSKMLIEQIDTLSHIANEFSNFAKLPNTNLEIVDLYDILQSVTHLFQQNTECEINLTASESLLVMADKEQCLRIFTNLLKNAQQSIPENRKGKIEIIAYSSNKHVTIKVKDNGCGISDDVKHKLFTPNFTTKSTGTGLGLAMVKNSVVSFNGTIMFDTVINEGTTFTIVFPAIAK